MNCIIVEDQAPAQRILQKFIADSGSLQLLATFSDPLKALFFLQNEQVDVLFLDVHLPKMSGIDFLKSINKKPYTIFTTAYDEYAIQGYELNVIDYLLKPFSFERFVRAIAKIPVVETVKNVVADPNNFAEEIFIKSGYEWVKISVKDIRMVKTDMDYTELYLNRKKLISAESLKHWESTLPDPPFTRVHKSYIVNLKFVEKVAGNQIYMIDGETVPIGRAYKERMLNILR